MCSAKPVERPSLGVVMNLTPILSQQILEPWVAVMVTGQVPLRGAPWGHTHGPPWAEAMATLPAMTGRPSAEGWRTPPAARSPLSAEAGTTSPVATSLPWAEVMATKPAASRLRSRAAAGLIIPIQKHATEPPMTLAPSEVVATIRLAMAIAIPRMPPSPLWPEAVTTQPAATIPPWAEAGATPPVALIPQSREASATPLAASTPPCPEATTTWPVETTAWPRVAVPAAITRQARLCGLMVTVGP